MPEMGPSGPPKEAAPAGGNPQEALKGMVMQTDQAIGKLAEVLGSEALAQLKEAFRQIISEALGGGGDGGGQRPPEAAPPETAGKPAQQAY